MRAREGASVSLLPFCCPFLIPFQPNVNITCSLAHQTNGRRSCLQDLKAEPSGIQVTDGITALHRLAELRSSISLPVCVYANTVTTVVLCSIYLSDKRCDSSILFLIYYLEAGFRVIDPALAASHAIMLWEPCTENLAALISLIL